MDRILTPTELSYNRNMIQLKTNKDKYINSASIIKILLDITLKLDSNLGKGLIYWYPKHNADKITRLLIDFINKNPEIYKHELVNHNIEFNDLSSIFEEYCESKKLLNTKELQSIKLIFESQHL